MSVAPELIANPAWLLAGKVLSNGWIIGPRVDRPANATGGYFSVGYEVRKADGARGFLKAFDFSQVWNGEDELRELQRLLQGYNFERDLLLLCKQRRLSRVAMALEDGSIEIPGAGILSRVYYVIFERADCDVRAYIDFESADVSWRIRTLHQAAAALQQLHKNLIAHQDLKPSNLLVFGARKAKLGDLGRASREGLQAPHDDCDCAGQLSYAPIELRYRHLEPDFRRRRLATDLYLLGSLVLFFFGNVGMTTALMSELNPSHYPDSWEGDYLDVLPYVQNAFTTVCTAFRSSLQGTCPDSLADDLSLLVKYLCDPDPRRRGHPLNGGRLSTQYSLERFITRLAVLADQADIARR